MGHPAEIRPTSKSGIPELEASKVRSSFPGSSDDKASAYNAGNLGSIPESGRSPGEGNGNPLQYSFLLGEFHGQRNLVSYSPWGSQRVRQD